MNSLYLRPRVCFWSRTLLFGLIRIWDVVRNGADLSLQRKPHCLITIFDTLIGEDMMDIYPQLYDKGCGCSSKNMSKPASFNLYNQLRGKKNKVYCFNTKQSQEL